jgi:cell division septation protein DedD
VASSDSFNTGQFVTIAVVVVIVSCVAGYYLAGGLQHQTEKQAVSQVAQQSSTSPQTASAPAPQSAPASGSSGNDYTAPNAPKIDIREEKAPPVSKPSATTRVASNPSDSEASQENNGPTDGSDDTGTVGTVPAPVTGNATTPAASAQSSDPDYEQTTGGTDSESNQEGSPATGDVPRPRYRVQVGTFTQAMSARSLADALRNRGYSTTTVTDRDGDKTVYHVQTCAFRSRSTADHVTLDLQRQGFPAFVTSISQ